MQFSLRPVFVGWITLLVQLPFQLFFTFWAATFFGSIFATLLKNTSHQSFVLFGALAFVTVPIVAYVGKKLNYAHTEYRFYDDRLEFEEGFFSINEKLVKLREVREVTMRKGFLQRFYNLGTIYLATEATGSSPANNIFFSLGFGNVSGSGIGVRDVTDPDGVFEKVKALVGRYRD
jgi:uncharacterized membrane protein YdbT with pleckstrin-like domain